MALTAADRCHICAHPLGSTTCPHPWDRPFNVWPEHLLGELKGTMRPDRHPGS